MSLARGSETETHGKGTGELRQRAVASLTSTHILSHRNTHTHTHRGGFLTGGSRNSSNSSNKKRHAWAL